MKESTRMKKQTTRSNTRRIIDMGIWNYSAGKCACIEADFPAGIWTIGHVARGYDFLIELTNLIRDDLHQGK